MVLVDVAIAWRDGKFAERFRQGHEEERRAWLERREDARARGEPFNEPAPDEAPPSP